MPKKLWDDSYPHRVFEMIIRGMDRQQVADALGTSLETLRLWCRDRPAMKDAVARAREYVAEEKRRQSATPPPKETFDLVEYSYRRLPPDLQEVWDRIAEVQHITNSEKLLEVILDGRGERAKKYLFVHAIACTNFNKSEACRLIGVHPNEADRWAREDPEFGKLLASLETVKEDWIEGCLLNLVAQGDTAATIFAARTKLRNRGYDPKVTVEHKGKVLHGHIDLDQVHLDLDTRRRILQAVRDGQGNRIALEEHEDEDD